MKPFRADTTQQPLRTHVDRLWLEHSPPLLALIPPTQLSRARCETELTTHPEVFADINATLEAWFTATHLPAFLESSGRNLHRHTARGRLLIGILCTLVSISATVLLLMKPSPFRPDGPAIEREWRLLLVPVLLGGVGYGLGSWAGMCFVRWRVEPCTDSQWLALAGVREDPTDTSTTFTALWRLTGTAWHVRRVQDRRLRKYQRRQAWKIAAGLTAVLAILAVILWFLPYLAV